MTVVEAVEQVMRIAGVPMTAREVLAAIQTENLYQFRAADPLSVVRAQLRRHSDAFSGSAAAPVRRFRLLQDDRFELLPQRSGETVRQQ